MSAQLFALVTNQGTAMPETVLVGADVDSDLLRARSEAIASAAGDLDGGDFRDVSDNDYIAAMFEDEVAS